MKFYQDKKKVELQVGIFTIVALTILILSYSWLTNWLEKRDYTLLQVKFPTIQTVDQGTPVTILGVQKGKVNSLEVEEDGILMHLLVELDFPLRSGTRIFVKETSIMGDVSVEIVPGKGKEYLDMESVLQGETGYSISGLIQSFSHLAVKVDAFLDEIDFEAKWGAKIDALLDSTMHFVQLINQTAEKSSEEITEIIHNVRFITSEMQDFTKKKKPVLEQTVDRTANSIVLLESTLNGLQESIRHINEITTQMTEKDSDFQEFISDRKLYEKMLETTGKLDSLLIDVKENPKRYFQIRIF